MSAATTAEATIAFVQPKLATLVGQISAASARLGANQTDSGLTAAAAALADTFDLYLSYTTQLNSTLQSLIAKQVPSTRAGVTSSISRAAVTFTSLLAEIATLQALLTETSAELSATTASTVNNAAAIENAIELYLTLMNFIGPKVDSLMHV